MAHPVNAFVDANWTVFAQVAVADKRNELAAIPRVLALLDLTGATVTDAAGCQREVAARITEGGGTTCWR